MAITDENGWMPIETAPRDGTRFLATGGGLDESMEVVTYHPGAEAWVTPIYTLDDTDYEPQGYNRPTHWQPLPKRPVRP